MSVLDNLENQVREVKQKALERRKREVRDEQAVEAEVKKGSGLRFQEEKGKVLGGKRGAQEVGGPMIGGDRGDAMELDGALGGGKTRGAKRGGSGGGIKGAAKRFLE